MTVPLASTTKPMPTTAPPPHCGASYCHDCRTRLTRCVLFGRRSWAMPTRCYQREHHDCRGHESCHCQHGPRPSCSCRRGTARLPATPSRRGAVAFLCGLGHSSSIKKTGGKHLGAAAAQPRGFAPTVSEFLLAARAFGAIPRRLRDRHGKWPAACVHFFAFGGATAFGGVV
jgi:hypothetical protein